MGLQPNEDLIWYYQQSASELGMKAQNYAATFIHREKPEMPSDRACQAAAKQKVIRIALRQLSPRLQSVLECAYETRFIAPDVAHKYDLVAPLIERAAHASRQAPSAKHKAFIAQLAKVAPLLLQAAHDAFDIVYGRQPSTRRQKVQLWLRDKGLEAA